MIPPNFTGTVPDIEPTVQGRGRPGCALHSRWTLL